MRASFGSVFGKLQTAQPMGEFIQYTENYKDAIQILSVLLTVFSNRLLLMV